MILALAAGSEEAMLTSNEVELEGDLMSELHVWQM